MAICKSCSAPLSANTNLCHYCGVRNDVDLQSQQDYTVVGQSERICPVCDIPLQTIDLKLNGHLYIEHCSHCFGLFFDPGEIETVLENSVGNVFSINWQLLDNINQERYPADHKVKYVKCPVCQVLMNRVNFGYRSGVVVDQCSKHGIWLDSGEITHLLEWKKAGGQLWNQQQQQEKPARKPPPLDFSDYANQRGSYSVYENNSKSELLKTFATLLFELFE